MTINTSSFLYQFKQFLSFQYTSMSYVIPICMLLITTKRLCGGFYHVTGWMEKRKLSPLYSTCTSCVLLTCFQYAIHYIHGVFRTSVPSRTLILMCTGGVYDKSLLCNLFKFGRKDWKVNWYSVWRSMDAYFT